MDISERYETLVRHLRDIYDLKSAAGMLGWDQRVNMPPDGAEARSRQLSKLQEIIHNRITDDELYDQLQALDEERDQLSSDQSVVVRETFRKVDRARKLPAEFVAEKSQVTSEAYNVWTEAKEQDDFETFLPYLEKNVQMARAEADYLGYEESPYNPLLDEYDPGLTESRVADLFEELREGLVPIVDEIAGSENAPPVEERITSRTWAKERQKEVGRIMLEQIGYDFDAGRIDTTVHPFCSGYQGDVRVTTRYNESNPLSAWTSLLHEGGHALYEQGLDPDTWGTPLSEPVGMGVHESQSRMWENMVGRSEGFWNWAWPEVCDRFPENCRDLSKEELLFIVHDSRPDLIRVEADEVTYNLHIILRFELEQKLIHGNMEARDLPDAWNEKMDEFLGVTPSTHGEGVLQDVHWASGAFGYFPSYALGNLIAAQLYQTAEEEIGNQQDAFAEGNFSPLLNWLRENVHRQGCRYHTDELVEHVTGSKLEVEPFLQHVRNEYLPYY